MEKIGKLIHKVSEEQIRKGLKEAESVFVIGYSGVSSAQMNILRQSLKNSKSRLLVVKNSTSKIVFDASGLKDLAGMLQGPCGLVFVDKDPIAASKVLSGFAKEYGNLKVEGGLLGNRVLNKSEMLALASLPTQDVLYTKLVMGLKSPVYGLVFALSNTLKKFVLVLEQIKNKK